ncbi:sensor histidine kinase [Blastococcus sp. SYSU D00669]
MLGWSPAAELEREVERVTASRAATVDSAAAELRRIERDLHDGVQARIASLGMNLGLAEVLLRSDPDAVEELLAEARLGATTALEDLRSVVRGMHPPVLADRGLAGAVEALALDVAVPVTVSSSLDGRAPAPVESAVYFAVAEALANVVKHSGASRAWVSLGHEDGVLRAVVGDDGGGGADPSSGTGLAGVARRIDAFDGTLTVSSPPGGPTTVGVEVPCALSSSRTTPSSGTA